MVFLAVLVKDALSAPAGRRKPISHDGVPAELLVCRSRTGAALRDSELSTSDAFGLDVRTLIDRTGIELDARTAPDGNRFAYAVERNVGEESSRDLYIA